MEYAMYIPTTYHPDASWPLVVVLHGLLSNPHHIIRYRGLTAEAERRGYIVVAPFGYNQYGWYGSMGATLPPSDIGNLGELSERDVLNVLGIARQQYHIDDRRIYLMGHSMGGAGTLHLGAAFSQLWAALAPMSPALPASAPLDLVNEIRHIPVMVVTGDADRITRVEPARELLSAMQNLDMDYCYKEIKGGGHGAPMLRPDIMSEIFDFFDARSRHNSAPSVSGPSVCHGDTSLSPTKVGTGTLQLRPPTTASSSGDNSQMIRKIVFTVMRKVLPPFLQLELLFWAFFYSVKSTFYFLY